MITADANKMMAKPHDKMPLIVEAQNWPMLLADVEHKTSLRLGEVDRRTA